MKKPLYRLLQSVKTARFMGKLTRSVGIHGTQLGAVRSISSIESLSSESGLIKVISLRKGTSGKRPPATILGGSEPTTFKSALSVNHPDFVLAVFENAYVLPQGRLLTHDRRLVAESLADSFFLDKHKEELESCWLWPRVTKSAGTCVLAYHHWAWNYYHCLLEFIPRLGVALEGLASCQINGFQEVKVLLPHQPASWMWELLDLIGVPKAHCLQSDGRQMKVNKLLFASRVGESMNTPAWAIQWIRNRLMAKTGGDSLIPQERLYVSRRNAANRRVVNEAEVEQTLQEFGFKTVTLEDLTVVEQIRLFSRAKAIVGPHGAGFTNIVFSQNAKVLEFIEASWPPPTFYKLSYDCGHDYRCLISKTADGANMHVDTDKLRQVIRDFLATPQKS